MRFSFCDVQCILLANDAKLMTIVSCPTDRLLENRNNFSHAFIDLILFPNCSNSCFTIDWSLTDERESCLVYFFLSIYNCLLLRCFHSCHLATIVEWHGVAWHGMA